MSRKSNCYDNAVMENFFRHLKEEMFRDVRFISTEALATHLDDYIH
ncbi:UNVERIFIED_CONTAM: transposase InsO family protein [Jeotgalibacillus campisalis]